MRVSSSSSASATSSASISACSGLIWRRVLLSSRDLLLRSDVLSSRIVIELALWPAPPWKLNVPPKLSEGAQHPASTARRRPANGSRRPTNPSMSQNVRLRMR
eukprot:gene3242-biopygen3114